jgi:hypothetical protein
MPFINEHTSEADIVKYGLREQSEEFRLGNSKIEWTIDRARDIYLRHIETDFRSDPIIHKFIFYWSGESIEIELMTMNFEHNEYVSATETLKILPTMRPNNQDSFWLPSSLVASRTQITDDFKDALVVRNGTEQSGLYSTYVFKFEF